VFWLVLLLVSRPYLRQAASQRCVVLCSVLTVVHRFACFQFSTGILISHHAYLIVSLLIHTKYIMKYVGEIEKPIGLILGVYYAHVTFA
jgi:hypothetical protein